MADKHIYWKQEKPELVKYHKKKAVGQLLLTTLFSGVVSALLICATAIMFIDAFEPQGEAIGKDYCTWFLVIAVLIMNLWNEWVHLWGKRIIGVAGNLVILFITLNVHTPDLMDKYLVEGLNSLSDLYVRWWNYHFGTSIQVQSGNAAYQLLAAEILLLVLAVILQWLAAFVRKRSVMLILPLGILCMELLVGLTPGWLGLSLVFVGGMLALYMDCNREICLKRLALFMSGVILAALVSGTLLGHAADSVYTLNQDWLQFQQRLESSIKNFNLKSLLLSGDAVNNQAPAYENKEVIQLSISEMPQGNIYLRGYHCNDYVDGVWEKDESSFRKECKEQGISEEDGAARLLQLRYYAATGSMNSRIQYDLTYTGISSKYCYLPYGVALEGDIADYSFSRDYQVEKGRSEEKYQVFGWQQTDCAVVIRGSYGALSENANAFYDWYNAFVNEHYMQVPDQQKAVKGIAASMKSQRLCREYLEMLDTDLHGRETVNAARKLLADMVADKLASIARYSLELDKLPAEQDAIEYFLTEGKKGFCVHFASAGVLILRELGVPARYVSGYLVNKDGLQGVKGAYSARVLDSDAHAWVEIYLDNYGWVPVEVTPGYGGEGLDFAAVNPQREEQSQEAQREEPPEDQNDLEDKGEETDNENSSEQPMGSENENDEGQFDSNVKDIYSDVQAAGSQDVQGTANGTADRSENVLLRWGAVLMAVCLAGALFYGGYRLTNKKRGAKERLLAGYIRYGYTRKAVEMINRRLYRILVKKTHKSSKKLSDADYLTALKEVFPQIGEKEWEMYFEVFRRAAYSQESISQEEAGSCYKMYQTVMKLLKK